AVMLHGPDVDAPVQSEQGARRDEADDHQRLLTQGFQPRPLTAPGKNYQHESERPQHAVREQFDWWHRRQYLEIDREQTPCDECRSGEEHAFAHMGSKRMVSRPPL